MNKLVQVNFSGSLQQVVESNEIALEKRVGVGNASVDVSFGGEIHGDVGVSEYLLTGSGVGYVAFDELIPWMPAEISKVRNITAPSIVKIRYLGMIACSDDVVDEVASNEA